VQTTFQYNGLVLLYAYLQRAYVHNRTLDLLAAPADPRAAQKLLSLLDRVGGAMSTFDKDAGLTEDDARAMRDIVDEARPLVQECLPQAGDSPQRQLAAVVCAVYAEEHVNNGIVRMGELLDPDIADRFRQRIPFFRSRAAMVSSWVQKATEQHELTPDEAAERDRLLSDVTVASRSVDADLRTITHYLAG
jgi:hypothetical protein